MSRLNMARNRTDAKLRYARVHLTELAETQQRGADFDEAHRESFLFQLLGVQDGLLQEIYIVHLSSQMEIEKVTYGAIGKALAGCESACPAFATLKELRDDEDSWLSRAVRLRNWSTHRRGMPRTYYKGGVVHLHDTRTSLEIRVDCLDLFGDWLEKMQDLVEEMRARMPGAENG